MKILQEPNGWIIENYAKFLDTDGDIASLRLNGYVLIVPSDNGSAILYNGMTKETVEIEDGDNIFDERMRKNMWFVPNDFDETRLVLEIKTRLFNGRPKTWRPLSYTILTTTNCNARCFYCYERNILKKDMTDSVASDVGDYIIRNYDDQEKKRPVRISWFGGEPLFNKGVIDIITGKLKEAGIPYASSMISNGYLFDEETVLRAKRVWNLRNVQITIDGTSENYKKAKNYANGDPDPLETILSNIGRLTASGIRVSVRINVGFYNCEDISSLVDILHERFPDVKNLSVYAHTLFDSGGVTDITDAKREEKVFDEMKKIEAKLSELGLGRTKRSDNSVKGTHCMADNGKHAVIQCDGSITLCEHYADSHKFTSIYSDEKDESVFNEFRKVANPYRRCFGCPLFLECSSLVMCEDTDEDCSEYRQGYKVQKKIDSIKRLAKEYVEPLPDS